MIGNILSKVRNGIDLTKKDAIALLNIKTTSQEFYELLAVANELSRSKYDNRAYIFAQIGINSAPCSGNCKFCSLAIDSFSVDKKFEKDQNQIVLEAKALESDDINSLFLMTTADYDKEKYLSTGEAVRNNISQKIQLVANTSDFDYEYAQQLKSVGFSGVYHVVRLREGIDTNLKKETRIKTLDAIKKAGLELFYCIEPIGPEHSYEEIADEMLRAKEYGVNIMAVMGRVNVPGTSFADKNVLSELELAKIVAVTRVVTDPKKSMNIHEPMKIPLLAGVNQLYAEYGSNPRDTNSDTVMNRGYDIKTIKAMLIEAGYKI
jgi:biotin synthase